ncbi:MAG: glycoside hydrolase family 172 protein, partial [Janthinobacterium lividum]
MRFIKAAIIAMFGCLCMTANAPVTAQSAPGVIGMDTLLRQESDLSQLPTLQTWTSNLQSSYDRTGGNDDSGKFLSGDQKDAVLADMNGPGAVVRIWSANPAGEIKIFIDNAPTPVIDTTFSRLFDGSFAPFKAPLCDLSSGGSYSYLPIVYAHHCHIELINGQNVYYQVNFLSFPKATKTAPFLLPLSPHDQAAVDSTNAVWAGVAVPKPSAFEAAASAKTAPAHQTLDVASYRGPGVIRRISLALPKAADIDLRRLVLRGYFDGHKTPDIEAPVSDFFGNAYGRKPFRTLLLSQAADGSFEADFPMPFARSARFTLENGSGAVQPLSWSADFVKAPFDGADTGYFHAAFFQELTKPKQAHIWTHISGQRGRFVGVVQTMASVGGISYLEGDDQFRADAQTWLPSKDTNTVVGPWNGTGTEDCFNSGWYFNSGPNALPVNALLVKDDNHGRINCLRWFLSDAPTFQSSLDAQIEHGGDNGDATDMYYSSVAYWYATGQVQPWAVMPAASALALPAMPLSLFNVPHGIEGETLNAVATGGGAGPQDMRRFGTLWSGNCHLFWDGSKQGDTLTLTLPAQTAGSYDLVGYFTKASDYGQV